ncbi:hypothetical protein BJ322DRAFT_1026157 [Thelephora terrestris]|uniref:Uncharacterized protein n=1 Tax=Thelephora terrestris TaxID=56493 RepID=A0A9P6HNS5_9AGAM|nr:hypothetical protein BJ322DRAFT_1026157 [Thelephora terrestris]
MSRWRTLLTFLSGYSTRVPLFSCRLKYIEKVSSGGMLQFDAPTTRATRFWACSAADQDIGYFMIPSGRPFETTVG